MNVTRPLLRYHGGKWRIAPWIISHFPSHKVYVEPFGGAASVLLRKPRSYAEVYNDLDGEIVNLFRVLRNPSQARELIRLVRLTPYARQEFEESYITAGDPVEQARRTLFRAAAGFASGAQNQYGTGFRNNTTRAHSTPADNWTDHPSVLDAVAERLRGVVIENMPALDLVRQLDRPEVLFYVDPPYVYDTRNPRNAGATYRHEMSDDDHRAMAEVLRACKARVVISGYRSALYDELFAGWQMVEKSTHADGAKDRIDCLWISPNAIQRPTLFAEVAP
jgi:DNA adenine methylase